MSWADRFTGAQSRGPRQYNATGGVGVPSGMGGVYHPTPSGGGVAPPSAELQSGVVNINPLDPAGVPGQVVDPISQLFDGIRQFTVGTNEDRDKKGFRDPSLLGNIPLVGNIGRGAANVIGGLGEVYGAISAGIGGGLERVSIGANAERQVEAEYQEARAEAMKTEEGREFFKEFEDAINREHGLFGTGLADDDAHWKSVAVRKWREDQQFEKPSLTPGAFTAPGSLIDSLTNMFDVMIASEAVVAKHWAQLDTPGQGGMDRIDLIEAVGDETLAFQPDKGLFGSGVLAGDPTTGLNQMEELVYAKLKSGDWTRDQAADFLASNNQAYGHAAVANIGGAVALDPTNFATLGASIAARAGIRGVLQVSKLAAAEAKMAEVSEALTKAKALRAAAITVRKVKAADRAVAKALEDVNTARDSLEAISAFRSSGKAIGRLNFLARKAEGSEKLGATFRLAGRAYGTLDGTRLGRAAKITRTIIDPLHAMDLHTPGATRMVDLYSSSVPRAVADTGGVQHYKAMLDEALRIDSTRQLHDAIVADFGVASANLGREGLIEMFRAGQIAGNLSEGLMKTLPNDLFETAVQTTKHRDLEKWLRFNTVKHVIQETWDELAYDTLSRQLEQVYHVVPEGGWAKALKAMSKEQRSFYKFAAYGRTNRNLLDFVANVTPEVAAKMSADPGRLVLLAKGTLTRVGGESLLTKLTDLKTVKARAKVIAEWQERYPSLRYISLDETNLEKSVNDFIEYLKDNMDRLPMQVTKKELKAIGESADELTAGIGEYKLGFRPEGHFLWGLERDAGTGLYRPATQAFIDHVGDGAIGYRPAEYLRTNIAGHPIVDVPVVRAVAKVVDYMDSAARIMKLQVSSAMVFEAARKRFIAKAVSGDLASRGVSEKVAGDWFDRITEFTREHQGYSGPRGMGGDDLYKAIKERNLIPQPLLNGERRLAPYDVMRLVLDAYDGDMRYIGLTQKLSGRAKKVLFDLTGSNWAGQIAEHAWPTMKFRYNPFFQLQEKIEPWVLSAQRGISFSTGAQMTEADRLTEQLLQRFTDNSLVRQGDLDQFEYSSMVLFGKSMQHIAAKPGSVLARVQKLAGGLTEVQGMKRINMLRTFRKGLGREIKAAWEEARPGDWAKMKDNADLAAGRIIDEDDFALQLVTENVYANDVFVSRIAGARGGLKADWANSIKTGEWISPTTLGEMKALDLDHVARSLRIVSSTGQETTDLNGLRQLLATEDGVMDKVADGLTRLGASKDYIRRVRNGLEFSWTGFWKTAAERFSLTVEESRSLQDMMAQAASLRNMTPVEFMSQVFSPSLIDGTEGVLGHIEGTARVLREARAAGRKISPRAAKLAETRTRIAGKVGVSTREDLVRQLSRTFSAHLDPSAKRALLLEFTPTMRQAVNDGLIKLDLEDIERLWDDLADNQLADRILGYMDGKLGSGAHDVIGDPTVGLSGVRDSARKYLEQRGVTPHTELRNYHLDEDLGPRTSKAWSDIPDTPFELTGRRPTITSIRKAGTKLKPKPDTVDQRTYDAFQDFVIDTQAQWDHMVAPKSKGGLELKVIISKSEPYADAAAMRADIAKGQLRVFAGNSDHALMTNEQTVMFRAVHDVFGRASGGLEFGARGDMNAAIAHAAMYSDTGRAAMLSEAYGRGSYANFSDDLVSEAGFSKRVPLNADDPIADFESRYPFQVPEGQAASLGPDDIREGRVWVSDLAGKKQIKYFYSQRVGDGIRVLPKDAQLAILQSMSDLYDEYPTLRVYHIDAVDFSGPLESPDVDVLFGIEGAEPPFGAFGVTFGASDNESVILINKEYFHGDWKKNWAEAQERNLLESQYDAFYKKAPLTGLDVEVPRESRFGVPYNVGPRSPEATMRHEAGHAFDIHRRPYRWDEVKQEWYQARDLPQHAAYNEMMGRLEKSAGRLDLSEYGFTNEAEFAGELFAYSTDPNLVVKNIASDDLREMVEEYQKFLIDTGEWKPRARHPMAGKTVREANALTPGSAPAPRKAGLLPQDILDEIGEKFIGRGKHIEANPDVARTAQMFGKWTDAVVTNGMLKGEKGVYGQVLADIAGLPTGAATPYNFSEAAIVNLATNSMIRKWDDAFRLQYFSQERTFFERSLNHPMFGMYPASYMWGKIMPEMVRFLAAEPFGNKTGGLLYSLMDVQAAIALRREYDPYFDANIEKLGHSQALSFGGYLLPSEPWQISASAPTWAKSISDQGRASAAAVAAGREPADLSLVDPAVGTFKKLLPELTTIPWVGRAVDEVFGAESEQEIAQDARDMNRAVRAAELRPTMQRIMQELQEALR